MPANDPADNRAYLDPHSSHLPYMASEPQFPRALLDDISKRGMSPLAYLAQEPRGVVAALIRNVGGMPPSPTRTKKQLDAIALQLLVRIA